MPGKVKYNSLSEFEKKKYLGDFYSMVALLKSREEVKNFLKDLLTLSEMVMLSRRIQIAKMLLEGNTQEEIRRKIKVGFSTINQVEKWLNNGFGGYKKIIKKYQLEYPARNEFEKYGHTPFSKEWIRKKFPLHYLLVNLLEKNTKK